LALILANRNLPAMRRLFSTFEDRLPSHGALLLRTIVAVALIGRLVEFRNGTPVHSLTLHVIAAAVGVFLLFGSWTPVAGITVAIIELFITLTHNGDPWAGLLLAGLGVSLSLLGPGAWSVDARRFGLKRIEIRRADE
jgi:uncharacterized membrane protein YphA (DoxX/SURF4 family)